ncbi:MAG: DUF2203 family protein [Armatimonadota bacterium]|nr:DUF2203 family protein [Armatimonadota bacterium]MDR7570583.1 DUF2203 family protein [Armatimonadota bacterium]MDR7614258.1 DUF2203 family protein [Armatimonadota bacterium]
MGALTFRAGKPVYYCWRIGEPQIRYRHGLDEGFTGRRPIGLQGWIGEPIAWPFPPPRPQRGCCR